MKKTTDLSGLLNFTKKVKNCKNKILNTNEMLFKICNTAINYAYSLYNDIGSITIHSEISNGRAVIYAQGDQIAYLEFGTGETGNHTYQGNLPEKTIEFYSQKFGKDIVLEYGWTYSYANKIDETQSLWVGFEAQAQMWKTAQYIRRILPQIIQEVVNSESIY